MMDLAHGFRAKSKIKMKEVKYVGIGLNPDSVLMIKLPDSRVLRIISRSLFLAIFILTLPSIGSIIRDYSSDLSDSGLGPSDSIGFESLPLVFQDLVDEGLLKKGQTQTGLILSPGIGNLVENLQILTAKGIDLVIDSNLDRQSLIPNEEFDFVFTSSFQRSKFINRLLKIDGILVMPIGNDPSNEFQQQANYKIVYVRRFDSTVVAMRKISLVDESESSRRNRKLCGVIEAEAKKAALEGLEDVLLEPPRKALAKSSYKKINFLPDLLEDSLQRYKRRIFITDEKKGVVNWFYENYPMRNQYFEVYESDGISDWLTKNVGEEDYVVMKAEAGVVEKMMKEKTMFLVDELFLECKNQWEDDGEKKTRKRAYWQCLELYGRVRDEGVAVHQWWG